MVENKNIEVKNQNSMNKSLKVLFSVLFLLLFTIHYSLFTHLADAELIDRVVAFVDDRAITLKEFRETYEKMEKVAPGISREEALDTLINRILLLMEAKRLKLEAKTDDELISNYIELKVKAFIRLREGQLREFYDEHLNEFGGADFDSVRSKIEEYLTEKEVNTLMKRRIAELRSGAYIKILTGDLRQLSR